MEFYGRDMTKQFSYRAYISEQHKELGSYIAKHAHKTEFLHWILNQHNVYWYSTKE